MAAVSVVGVEDGVSDSKLAMTVAFSSRDGLAGRTLVDTECNCITSFLQDFTNHTFADRSRDRSTCASKCCTVSTPVHNPVYIAPVRV